MGTTVVLTDTFEFLLVFFLVKFFEGISTLQVNKDAYKDVILTASSLTDKCYLLSISSSAYV